MKINGKYVLTTLGDAVIVVPVGKTAQDFNGIIRLNHSGGFVMRALMDGVEPTEIEEKLMAEYPGVDQAEAHRAVTFVIEKLLADGILEE